MPGLAQTSKFMLGTATLSIGAQTDLMNLGAAQSLGLVKNVALKTAPGFVELTQGVKNSIVASIQNKNDMTVDAEMFEYTAKNMTYGVSLDGSSLTASTVATTTTAALTPTGGPPAVTPAIIPVTSATGLAVGQYLFVHVDASEQIFTRQITAITGLNVTVNAGFPVTIPTNALIEVVNMVPLGSTRDNPYLSAKIVGQLADNSWVTVFLGKVRVTSGLSLAFKTDNFDNIPLGLTVYDLTPSDPNYSFFTLPDGTLCKAMIFTK